MLCNEHTAILSMKSSELLTFLMTFVLYQSRDRQKKKSGTKGIRIDAEGDAYLEDLTNPESQVNGSQPSPDPEKGKSNNKKVPKFIFFR